MSECIEPAPWCSALGGVQIHCCILKTQASASTKTEDKTEGLGVGDANGASCFTDGVFVGEDGNVWTQR